MFRLGDRVAARRRLGVEDVELVLVFAGHGIRTSDFKDYATFDAALTRLGSSEGGRITAFALGSDGERTLERGRMTVREVRLLPHTGVVEYLRAADLYLHAARAETFPLTILEALACGVPVVASAVGGVPEQITPQTGILVVPGDPDALAAAVSMLEDDPERRTRMGFAAARCAEEHYSLQRQSTAFLDWFAELVEPGRTEQTP